jgi:transcriptional regulator with GAF, ATPase, and Fis domain
VDVRIIAATSAELKDMVDRNEFRSDLYYRFERHPDPLAIAQRPARGRSIAGKALHQEILPEFQSRPEDLLLRTA